MADEMTNDAAIAGADNDAANAGTDDGVGLPVGDASAGSAGNAGNAVSAAAGDDALLSRVRVIEDQPLESRAAAFMQVHDELQRRLEGGDSHV